MKKVVPVLIVCLILIFNVVPAHAVEIWDIGISCDSKWIHVQNNQDLKDYLNTRSAGSLKVAKGSKYLYSEQVGSSINISDMSLAVEILGHVCPDKIARYIPFGLGSSIISHTSVIDCGERSVDGNRWVWDTIATTISTLANNPVLLIVAPDTTYEPTVITKSNLEQKIREIKKNNPDLKLDDKIMLKVGQDIVDGTIDPILLDLASN